MRGYFGLGQISATEKSDILDQHKSVYNGYRTLQPEVSNTQPLTVYDFAGDKDGMVVNNKGEVKKYTNMGINEQTETKEVCDECGAMMTEGVCNECGGQMDEETGHLDDIYKVKDLNLKHGDFDYVEGGGNDYATFEGMRKNLYKEDDVIDDDGFEDLETGEELGEQGGNADDMDTDDVEPAYDFESGGPESAYSVNEYDKMESAWADELDEVDISGSQGIYSSMKSAYDFDSEGPGKAGPYQEFSYESVEDEDDYKDRSMYEPYYKDEDDEFMDYDGDDEEDEWEEIEEELQEEFKIQKTKITEMFNRFKNYN